jgi:ABC-type branched-subunit amino acid transport system substrate-binding protein
MSAPGSGASQALGQEMKKGVNLAFAEQNAAGGVRGRQLVLDFRDDQYTPTLAEQAVRDLLAVQPDTGTSPHCPTSTTAAPDGMPTSMTGIHRGPEGVFALLGNVGTPTMVRTGPIAVETSSLFFGAFTGAAKFLRDGTPGPCAKYIFNVRASYGDEARATLEYFTRLGVPDYAHLISFDQNDAFGDAGYNGLTAAYTALMRPPIPEGASIARFRYTRNDLTSVPDQVVAATAYMKKLLQADSAKHTVGVMMTDTYGAAAAFIQGVRDWQFGDNADQSTLQQKTRLALYFSNVSFVGPNTLAEQLKSLGTYNTDNGSKAYAEGVLVSQVVPNYASDTSDGVRQYVAALNRGGDTPSFTSLEGYLSARIFVAGLLKHQGPFDPDALVTTFENLPSMSALGFGASAGFTADSHNFSGSVWGTSIGADGSFSNRYFWSLKTGIQIFE